MAKLNLNIFPAFFLLIMALAGHAAEGAAIRVPDDYSTIQASINDANTDDQIEVAPGTYYEAINFNGKTVRLYSSGGPSITEINGVGNYHVVQCVTGEGPSTILEGFTITGGNANGADSNSYGGGMYNYYSSPTVIGCNFIYNLADSNGGGMYNEGSSPTVTNCTFISNFASYGGGMFNDSSSPTVTNCTLSLNDATMGNGGGIYNKNSNPTVANCIFWGDTPDEIYNESSSPTVSYSDIQSGYDGTGNINANPVFYDADTGDLRLSAFSPCVDAGNNSAVGVSTDLCGNPRFVDDTGVADTGAGTPPIVDMGACERQANSVTWGMINVPGDFDSIQEAINEAYIGDQIIVAPGTYNENINFNGKAIMLRSTDPNNPDIVAATVIDGTGHYHVVQCVTGEGPSTVLSGFTITGGNANGSYPHDRGGGMYNSNSSPTVTNCTFSSNIADHNGAGMCNYQGNPTVTNCTFTGNSATYGGGMSNINYSNPTVTNCKFYENFTIMWGGRGGGMYNLSSSPTVTNCTFSVNSAEYGGGMSNMNYSNPTVTNCTFNGNSGNLQTHPFGGGMSNINYSSPKVTNCTFSGNSATYGGGMGNMDYSSPTVTKCSFSVNSAEWGGGMYNGSTNSNPTVINCTFRGNSSVWHGGGMRNMSSSPTVTNCTFIGNVVSKVYGGGMGNSDNSNPTVTNCTFSGNSATHGGGIGNYRSSPTVINCILWGNSPDEIYNEDSSPIVTYSDVQGGCAGIGNIKANPRFVNANNPDPNLWNLRLMPDSPCFDAGDNNSVSADITDLDGDGNTVEPIPYDLDGRPRFVDGHCSDTVIVGMGAYEFNWLYIGDFAGGCNIDFADFAVFALSWLSDDTPTGNWNPDCDIDDPPDGIIDVLDLKIFAENWLAGIE